MFQNPIPLANNIKKNAGKWMCISSLKWLVYKYKYNTHTYSHVMPHHALPYMA